MRISVDADDRGYSEFAFRWKVIFNGTMIRDCITADDVKGYVIRYKRTNGKLTFNDDAKKIDRERVDGLVTLIPPDIGSEAT